MIRIGNSIGLFPTKEFFITTWVKDIRLDSAIFDLIDNSIDAAKKIRGYDLLEGFEIRIKIENNAFTIRDNCGGITLEIAENHAFKFGKDSNNTQGYDNIVGRYNVGMKRAMFKIGRFIELESHTSEDHFKVIIDVDKWGKKPGWDVDVNECTSSYEKGTIIKITKINKGIKSEFNKKGYISKLREVIALKFKDSILKGIKIYLKEDGVYKLVKIASKENNEVLAYEKEIKNSKYKGDVKIFKSEENMSEAGWNVYFNDRLVVNTNKSQLTGWNLKLLSDKYENIVFCEQYYGFRGYLNLKEIVQFSLPFTTTKEGLDKNHENYEKILEILIEAMKRARNSFEKPNEVNISYKRPRAEVELLKVQLDVNTAKAVGEKTYDIYIGKE
jgi:hypothetical protein